MIEVYVSDEWADVGCDSSSELLYKIKGQPLRSSPVPRTSLPTFLSLITMSPIHLNEDLDIDSVAVIGAGPCGLSAAK
jgi:hypothetical protein